MQVWATRKKEKEEVCPRIYTLKALSVKQRKQELPELFHDEKIVAFDVDRTR
eukprot:m.142405 g.142405  ORF g.142405 m.142405 type:complete len:52 (+) comp15993_c0_seq4:58-213(+)